jgi:hypothetical protein
MMKLGASASSLDAVIGLDSLLVHGLGAAIGLDSLLV